MYKGEGGGGGGTFASDSGYNRWLQKIEIGLTSILRCFNNNASII